MKEGIVLTRGEAVYVANACLFKLLYDEFTNGDLGPQEMYATTVEQGTSYEEIVAIEARAFYDALSDDYNLGFPPPLSRDDVEREVRAFIAPLRKKYEADIAAPEEPTNAD